MGPMESSWRCKPCPLCTAVKLNLTHLRYLKALNSEIPDPCLVCINLAFGKGQILLWFRLSFKDFFYVSYNHCVKHCAQNWTYTVNKTMEIDYMTNWALFRHAKIWNANLVINRKPSFPDPFTVKERVERWVETEIGPEAQDEVGCMNTEFVVWKPLLALATDS